MALSAAIVAKRNWAHAPRMSRAHLSTVLSDRVRAQRDEASYSVSAFLIRDGGGTPGSSARG
jgi:hypothetical protein